MTYYFIIFLVMKTLVSMHPLSIANYLNLIKISTSKTPPSAKLREVNLPHQYGQHLVSVFCTDDAVLMVDAEQHNLCLKLGIIQQVLKVLPVIN